MSEICEETNLALDVEDLLLFNDVRIVFIRVYRILLLLYYFKQIHDKV